MSSLKPPENSSVVAEVHAGTREIGHVTDVGSVHAHRIEVLPDGSKLYTENEEDAFATVIDLRLRKRLKDIPAPSELAGLGTSPDGRTIVMVDAKRPELLIVDTATDVVVRTVRLVGHEQAAQIARYSPDGRYLVVTSHNEAIGTVLSSDLETQRPCLWAKAPWIWPSILTVGRRSSAIRATERSRSWISSKASCTELSGRVTESNHSRFSRLECPLWVISDHGGRSHSIAHVRFAPESGQLANRLGVSALCQSRLNALQQRHCYSTTSSARNSSAGEIVISIALAVLRFTTTSNLVGCSIGRSAGFAPRKTLSLANSAHHT